MPTAEKPSAADPATSRAVEADHPWPGLKAYTEETRRFFFGRDEEIGEIFTRVREHPLTVLHGVSGVGKSSLLGAGLIPKLRAEGFRPVMLRFVFEAGAPALAEQVRRALAVASTDDEKERGKLLVRWGEAKTLWELLHRTEVRPDFSAGTPVLVFDQFEEVFTFGPKSVPRHAERVALLQQVADVIENRMPSGLAEALQEDEARMQDFDFGPSPLRMVMVLREDFMGQLEAWRKSFPSLLRNLMGLRRLTGPQALEAVVRAGRVEGRELVGEEAGTRIVRLVANAAADTPLEKIEVSPPLLSLLCDELNQALQSGSAVTAPLVEQLSGEILQSFYERSFAGLPDAVRLYVEERLVTASGHRNPVAQADAEAELRRTGVPDADQALATLITRRLLNIEERGGLLRLEITHDVLTDLAVRSRTERLAGLKLGDSIRAGHEKAEAQAREMAIRRERARKRRPVIVMVASAVVALVGVAAAWRARQEAQHSALEARRQFEMAEQQQAKAQHSELAATGARREAAQKDAALMAQLELAARSDRVSAADLIKQGRKREAFAYLARACDYAPGNSLAAQIAVHIMNDWSEPSPVAIHPDCNCAAYSPDGKRLFTASRKHGARITEVLTGKVLSTLQAEQYGAGGNARFSPDGSRLLISGEGLVQVWDTQSGERLILLLSQQTGGTEEAEFSPDGSHIVIGGRDGLATVWDAKTGKNRIVLKGDLSREALWDRPQVSRQVRHPRFNGDGSRIITSGDIDVPVWDARTGQVLFTLRGHEKYVSSAEYSPDGSRIVTASWDKTVRVWDANGGALLAVYAGHEAAVRSALFSPDGTRILTISEDKTARVWDAGSGKEVTSLQGLTETPGSAEFSRDGLRLLTVSGNTVRLWETSSGRLLATMLEYEEKPNPRSSRERPPPSAHFSPDGSRILTGTAWEWEVAGVQLMTEFRAHESGVTVAAFSPNGDRIVTGSDDQTARVWDAQSGHVLAMLESYVHGFVRLVFSADGARIMSLKAQQSHSDTHLVYVWDAQSGKMLLTIGNRGTYRIPGNFFRSAQLSPDGRRVLATAEDGAASVWDIESGKVVIELQGHTARVHSAQYSPDGSRIVTAGGDRTVRLWDGPSGKHLSIIHQQAGSPMAWNEEARAEFTSDGSRIMAAFSDGAGLQVLDAQSSVLLFTLRGYDLRYSDLQFSADGGRALVASSMKAQVWDTLNGAPLTKTLETEFMRRSAQISPDGNRLVTIPGGLHWSGRVRDLQPEDHLMQVWDAQGGRLLLAMQAHEDLVNGVQFSSDGSRLVTTSKDRTARVWEMPPVSPAPAWFSDFLRYLSWETFGAEGEPVSLTPAEWLVLRDHLKIVIGNGAGRWADIARWHLAHSAQRPIHPGATVSRSKIADQLISVTAPEWDIRRAYDLDPAHPLVQLALARFEADPARKAFLQTYSLDRMAKDASLAQRERAEALLQSPEHRRRDRARILLGMVMHDRHRGLGSDGRAHLTEALSLGGDDAAVVLLASWAYAEFGEWRKVLELARRAETLMKPPAPDSDDGLHEKIQATIAVGQWNTSRHSDDEITHITAYMKFAEAHPEWRKAECIAAIEDKYRAIKEALERLRKATLMAYPELED